MPITSRETRDDGVTRRCPDYDVWLDRHDTIFIWLMANREYGNGDQRFFSKMRRNIIQHGHGVRTTKLYHKCTRLARASVKKRAHVPYITDERSLQEVKTLLHDVKNTVAPQADSGDGDIIEHTIKTVNGTFIASITCTFELTGQVSVRSVQLLQSIVGVGTGHN